MLRCQRNTPDKTTTKNDETMNATKRKMAVAATMLASAGAWAQAPVIGIAATPGESSQVAGNDYVTAVTKAGGIPLILPATNDAELIEPHSNTSMAYSSRAVWMWIRPTMARSRTPCWAR